MATMNKDLFGRCIRSFSFKEIFNYFGWNNDRIPFPPIEIDNQIYQFVSIAEKSGFRVVECIPLGETEIPPRNIRNRIESAFSQMSHDHIIIFTDSKKKGQIWQFVYRTMSQGTKRIEVEYDIRMNPEKIYERAAGLVFELDEEDKITIIDVIERVKGSLSVNAEKVTKKFYDYFKAQQKNMVDSIGGIPVQEDREWYASLMLNRLMFCYFIQKRRFLNNDMDYLNNKLKEVQCQKTDGFHSFYREFLLILFHDGLASQNRSPEIVKSVGNIPYLNGGLFDIHHLEKKYGNISIPDETFEKLFAFFDTWDWHLDSNSKASSTEINPDILGYIFEKYINDRAKLGAYYTKNDITEYIARNSIIPTLLDKVKGVYPIAFDKAGSFWDYVKKHGERYIFAPVAYGVSSENFTPPVRNSYTQLAPESLNSGKENNLDVLRREYYKNLVDTIRNGEITSTEQLVEYNLDIRTLIYDYINETLDYGFVYRFYESLKKLTVIDPSCGSGAFLLAAINILEPLYEACLSKLEYISKNFATADGFSYAQAEIDLYKSAPNLTFWIFKQALIRNIYGVDIISEAVEIAKLRMFLRLMACVEPDYSKPNMGIEPLPDLDYNICSGNSLVGFKSLKEAMCEIQSTHNNATYNSIMAEATVICRDLKQAISKHKDICSSIPYDVEIREKTKIRVNSLLIRSYEILDKVFFDIYGTGEFDKWKATTKPLHWAISYADIMEDNRGFDVVFGNPPYIKNAEVTRYYSLAQYATQGCGNVYACFVERATEISTPSATLSMILQLPIACTDGMEDARALLVSNYPVLFFATFDDRPGKLFEELQHIRVSIITCKKLGSAATYTTKFTRWYSETRSDLFQKIHYFKWEKAHRSGSVPKIGDSILNGILKKLNGYPTTFAQKITKKGTHKVFYHNAPLYWIRGSKFSPYFYNERDGEGTSSQYKSICVNDEKTSNLLLAVLNSSLFYLWFVVYGDMRHLNKREIEIFPWCAVSDEMNQKLSQLLDELMADYEKHKTRKECIYGNTGLVIYDEYHPKSSKRFMDMIDKELAVCYGLTEEELDYIINYDIKFRLGGADS